MVAASNDADLESARARLFDDQHQSLTPQADLEQKLLDPNMEEMLPVRKKRQKSILKQRLRE